MINRIINNWSLLRIIRLIIGVYMLFGGISQSEKLLLFFGGLFTIQAIFNFGCSSCISGNCKIETNKLNETKELDTKT